MSATPCPQCGYLLDAFDTKCPRCSSGHMVLATNTACPHCGSDNSNKRFSCTHCFLPLGVPLGNIEKRPLKEYQTKAAELGKNGDLLKSAALLREAAAFYPQDLPTRHVLSEILERMNLSAEAQTQRDFIFEANAARSQDFITGHAETAFNQADFPLAARLFELGVKHHPNSISLHEGWIASLEGAGDSAKARSQKLILTRLKQQQHEFQATVQSRNDARAHANETAGMVGGVAIGSVGAAIGGGITLVSVLAGIAVALVGVALCFLSVLLFITCIGFPLAILCIMAGFGLIATGFTIAMGGAAAGAGTGCLGLFTGGLASGVATAHRKSRKK